jgi:hypothetical protein
VRSFWTKIKAKYLSIFSNKNESHYYEEVSEFIDGDNKWFSANYCDKPIGMNSLIRSISKYAKCTGTDMPELVQSRLDDPYHVRVFFQNNPKAEDLPSREKVWFRDNLVGKRLPSFHGFERIFLFTSNWI